MTLSEVVRQATARLAACGIDGPGTDARLLIAHALSLDRLALVMTPDRKIADAEVAAIAALIDRRAAREPVSRIIGERWFRGRPFRLNRATLDPRPDSEVLVDAVLAHVHRAGLGSTPLRLLDLGTGTGCLLLTLLAELPQAVGVGVDVSAEALAMGATNASSLGIEQGRVQWVRGSGFDGVTGIFNVILSNPPYIPTSEIEGLDPEVRVFDPFLALDGGGDGLDFYRAWCGPAREKLIKSMGMLIFEVGVGQAEAVSHLAAAAFDGQNHTQEAHQDLGGITRCVAVVTR